MRRASALKCAISALARPSAPKCASRAPGYYAAMRICGDRRAPARDFIMRSVRQARHLGFSVSALVHHQAEHYAQVRQRANASTE
jgi:hypothetical protein